MLAIKNLSKSYYQSAEPQRILSRLNLEVKSGEAFGCVGLNGAGKTTLLKIVAGLIEPDANPAAKLRLKGMPLEQAWQSGKIGYLGEIPAYISHLTGRETLQLCANLFGNGKANDTVFVRGWLKQLGLEEKADQPVSSYSKGMRHRLMLGTALINDPELILLDEPLDGLDPVGRQECAQLIHSAKKSGAAVLITTHSLLDIELLCDRMGVLQHGQMKKSVRVKTSRTQQRFFEQYFTTND